MIKCIQCQYRHGGCSHDWNNEVQDNCKEFKIGGCYSCKYYYGKYGEFTEQETDR